MLQWREVLFEGRKFGISRHMSTHFRNAPVTEIGITFWIEPSAEQPNWYNLADELHREFREDYPHGEIFYENNVEVTEKTNAGFPKKGKVSSYIRQTNFWSKTKDRLYFIGGDFFSSRGFRSEDSSNELRFAVVSEETNRIFSRYVSMWKPQQIKQFAISYVDDIRLPLESKPDLQINDYLKLGVTSPFSPISFSDCEIRFSLPVSENFGGKMQVRFYRAPPEPERAEFRMMIHWDCLVENVNSMDMAIIQAGLEYGHQQCYDCFLACMTPKLGELFNPIS